jgi:hypothetical protein
VSAKILYPWLDSKSLSTSVGFGGLSEPVLGPSLRLRVHQYPYIATLAFLLQIRELL